MIFRHKRYQLLLVFLYMLYICSSLFANPISLADFAKENEAVLYWDGMSSSGILEKNGHQITFSATSPFLVLDYSKIVLCDNYVDNNGTFFASNQFRNIALELFQKLPPEPKFRVGAILIDPGHGGSDPGTLATHTYKGKTFTVYEKDLVLSVAKDLYKKLQYIYPDKKILLTRDTDDYLSLSDRTNKANSVEISENEAVIFVSIHANATPFSKTPKGFEVWYLQPGYRRNVLKKNNIDSDVQPILNSMLEEEFTTESILIAKYINDGLKTQIGSVSPSRGIKPDEWYVCKHAYMPSVLVEIGFVTNPEEAFRLNDSEYLRKISLGIYNGLTGFVTHFEKSRGFTATP